MKNLDRQVIQSALLDISKFDTVYSNGEISLVNEELLQQIYARIVSQNGYAVCYNTCHIMLKHGLDIKNASDAEIARQFLENIFRLMAAKIDVSKFSPISTSYDRIVKMDVDGFHVNKSHSPNTEHTATREFVTTKCVHFDAATPFLANIYGPNKNISKGLPVICDTRSFCVDKNIKPIDLVENIPNHYNVVVKNEFYQDLLNNYSFALDMDLTNDLVMIVLYNEVEGGVAHAATQPFKLKENEETARPIRHVEYQFNNADDLSKWYEHYNLRLSPAGNSDEKIPASRLDYYDRGDMSFENFVKVKNG